RDPGKPLLRLCIRLRTVDFGHGGECATWSPPRSRFELRGTVGGIVVLPHPGAPAEERREGRRRPVAREGGAAGAPRALRQRDADDALPVVIRGADLRVDPRRQPTGRLIWRIFGVAHGQALSGARAVRGTHPLRRVGSLSLGAIRFANPG